MMIDQMSGYTAFTYQEIYAHQERLHKTPVHCVWGKVIRKEILFQLGSIAVRFGSWLIRLSTCESQKIHSAHPLNQ
jgi:hypothetical protein